MLNQTPKYSTRYPAPGRGRKARKPGELSKDQIQIIVYTAQGFTLKEIGAKMYRNAGTISSLARNAAVSAKVLNRIALVTWAHHRGLINLDEITLPVRPNPYGDDGHDT